MNNHHCHCLHWTGNNCPPITNQIILHHLQHKQQIPLSLTKTSKTFTMLALKIHLGFPIATPCLLLINLLLAEKNPVTFSMTRRCMILLIGRNSSTNVFLQIMCTGLCPHMHSMSTKFTNLKQSTQIQTTLSKNANAPHAPPCLTQVGGSKQPK